MPVPKIALILAVLMACPLGSAMAQHDPKSPAQAGPEQATPEQARPEETRPAPPKKPPPKRRAVHQIVDGMPAYGPRLTSPPPVPVSPQPAPSSVVPSTIAPPPAAISRCDAGGCTDVNGTRYNGAAGNTVIGPQGRTCTSNGGTIQCF
jgi:hypothetical protein